MYVSYYSGTIGNRTSHDQSLGRCYGKSLRYRDLPGEKGEVNIGGAYVCMYGCTYLFGLLVDRPVNSLLSAVSLD